MTTISEDEFRKLCDDIYLDRERIYSFNPNMSHREALLWMLLGCLLSLLSLSQLEQSSFHTESSTDPYGDAILELLQPRMQPAFDPQMYIAELTRKAELDEPDAGS
jgi:hypothetical protein